MTRLKITLDKRRETDSKEYPIKFYVSHRKDFWINTGYKCSASCWDGQKITAKAIGYKQKNTAILDLYLKTEDCITDLTRSQKIAIMTDKELKQALEDCLFGSLKIDHTVSSYIDDYLSTIKKDSTKGTFVYTKKWIEKFDPMVRFGDVTVGWMCPKRS